jgi:hypothetical protein
MVGILKKHYLAALNTIVSYRPMVNDFEFIQSFGGNRVPIDEGGKKKKPERNLSDLNMVTRFGHHNNVIFLLTNTITIFS